MSEETESAPEPQPRPIVIRFREMDLSKQIQTYRVVISPTAPFTMERQQPDAVGDPTWVPLNHSGVATVVARVASAALLKLGADIDLGDITPDMIRKEIEAGVTSAPALPEAVSKHLLTMGTEKPPGFGG
jgi:hypothetical protein